MYEKLKQPNFDVLCHIDDVLLLFFQKDCFLCIERTKETGKKLLVDISNEYNEYNEDATPLKIGVLFILLQDNELYCLYNDEDPPLTDIIVCEDKIRVKNYTKCANFTINGKKYNIYYKKQFPLLYNGIFKNKESDDYYKEKGNVYVNILG